MNNNWPNQNHSCIKLEHLYYRAWSRMYFFMLDIWKAQFMIEPLPRLRIYGGRHILSQSRQWNQEHISREYANFITSKGYIWSPSFSVSHLMRCLMKWKLSIWFLLWLLWFYLDQSFLVSSEAPRTLLSKILSQISSKTLQISFSLNRFLITRLLIT